MTMTEYTLALIKPDVSHNDVPSIYDAIESAGLEVVSVRSRVMTETEASALYAAHRGKSFFPELVAFMTKGPSLVLVIRGENACQRWRALMGATDPSKAEPGTLRQRFGTGGPANAVHGSDNAEIARAEAKIFGFELPN